MLDARKCTGIHGTLRMNRQRTKHDKDPAVTNANYYLEDLRVGQRFETAAYTVTEAEIKTFALAFDPQPFHIDEERARLSLFRGLAASGWHTAAITMRLIVDCGFLAAGVIGANGEIAWPRPTRPGDTLHVTGEVLEIIPSASRNDRGTVVMRNETRNQRDEIVQQFTARLIVFTRPAAQGE
jgi:acyl dehydratase